MIYLIIISAGVAWAMLALFSSKFNHLDNLGDDYYTKDEDN